MNANKNAGASTIDGKHKAATIDGQGRGFFIFLVVYLLGLSMLGSFVNDMYTPAMPEMVGYFHAAVPTVQLGLTMTLIGAAIGQFVMGPVSEHTGRRPVLFFSLALCGASGLVSVFSPNITVFLIWRFFQGIGASGGYFLARTIPADLYGGRALAKFMAIIGAVNGIAPASAPILGGFIAQTFTWKGIFYSLAMLAALLLLISPWMKETLPKAERSHASVGQSLDNYLKLLRNKPFMTHVMLKGAALAILFAYISSAPFIVQRHYGFSESVYGCIIGGNAVFLALGSMFALKFNPLKKAAFYGTIGAAACISLESAAIVWVDDFWLYESLLLPMLFCMGMVFSASNTLAMNEGRYNAGEASAILGIYGYVLGGLASPLVGIGNVLHSTPIVFMALTVLMIIGGIRTRRTPADLTAQPQQQPAQPPKPAQPQNRE